VSPVTVHQLVPSLVPGDATTSHTLQVQDLLRARGYESDVFALAIHPELEARARLVEELRGPTRADRYIIYQYSAVSGLADWLIGRREQVALNYHNVTPPAFFRPWERDIALSLVASQVQVAQLAPRLGLGICDSAFNASDLEARGARATAVVPILLDVRDFEEDPDPVTADGLEQARRSGGSQWLFVGGIAPHKAQHRLVQALAAYRRTFDPEARLSLVGRVISPAYDAALRRLVHSLGLEAAVDLPGWVSHGQLAAYYRAADVYVCLSGHEGFCVPLLEAMFHEVPVVATAAGAVPETLGAGGLLIVDDSPHVVATSVAHVVSDHTTRATLLAAGRARLEAFAPARTRATLAAVVDRWVMAGGDWPGGDGVGASWAAP
jgi:glycosyltransferase involved in cell wall biosynthesis